MNRLLRHSAALSLAVLLAACGGGGNDSAAPTNAGPTVDLQTAHADALSYQYAITGWTGSLSTPVTGSQQQSRGPVTDATLQGVPVKSYHVYTTTTLTANGTTTTHTTDATMYADPVHGTVLAADENSDSGAHWYRTYNTSYPSRVTAGESGTAGTGATFTDNTMSTPLSHWTTTWAASADTPTSLVVSYTTQVYDPSNTLRSVGVARRRVTTQNLSTPLDSTATNYATDGTTATSYYVYTPQ